VQAEPSFTKTAHPILAELDEQTQPCAEGSPSRFSHLGLSHDNMPSG
jgi:hypothetical protein